MELKSPVYVPTWVKTFALILLCLSFIVGLCIAFAAFLYDKKEWAEPGLSIAQFSVYGIATAVIILYSERETSVLRLSERMDEFFCVDLKSALSGIRMPVLGSMHGESVHVECHHIKSQPRAFYLIKYNSYEFLVQVDANLRQIVVMYHYPISSGEDSSALDDKLKAIINPAKDVGWIFSSAIALERFDNRHYYELFFRMKMGADFLLSSADIFFWATDISVMTRSALLNGIESGLLQPRAAGLTPSGVSETSPGFE